MSIAISGKAVCGRAHVILGVMAATVFSALVLVGCGKDDDEGPSLDSKLFCANGEAWTATVVEDGETFSLGFIFKSNGELVYIVKNGDGLIWIGFTGTWSTSGSNITLKINFPDDGPGPFTGALTYNISGNSLKITADGATVTFTKTDNITYTDFSDLMKPTNDSEQASLKKLFNK